MIEKIENNDFLNFYAEILLAIAKKRNVKLYLHEKKEVKEKYVKKNQIISTTENKTYFITEYEKRPTNDDRCDVTVIPSIHSSIHSILNDEVDEKNVYTNTYQLIMPLENMNDFIHLHNKKLDFTIQDDKENEVNDYSIELVKQAPEKILEYFITEILKRDSINKFIDDFLIGNLNKYKYLSQIIILREDALLILKKYIKNKQNIETKRNCKIKENYGINFYSFCIEFSIKEELDQYFPNEFNDLFEVLTLTYDNEKMLKTLIYGMDNYEHHYFNERIFSLLKKNNSRVEILNQLIIEVSQKDNKTQTYTRDIIEEYFVEEIDFITNFKIFKENAQNPITEKKLTTIILNISLNDLHKNYPIKHATIDFYHKTLNFLIKGMETSFIHIEEVLQKQKSENDMMFLFCMKKNNAITFNHMQKLLENYFSQYIVPIFSIHNKEINIKEWEKQNIEEILNMSNLVDWLESYWSAQQLEEKLPLKEEMTRNKL